MKLILLIDFGSTYTKLTAVDPDAETVVATAKAPTTVETNIMDGLMAAMDRLTAALDGQEYEIVEKVASSSAAGGLRMDAIGLVPELTTDAARLAVLNAGAKLIRVYSFELAHSDIESIRADRPDILLLAGGTDGGNRECILHNARMLADSALEVPVVVAGNRNCGEEIQAILAAAGKTAILTENVLPAVNRLNIEPARRVIRDIFIRRIIEAKGVEAATAFIDAVLMPTPNAVLNGAQLLADGTEREPGIGDLILVDIGGATTDIHSVSDGKPTQSGMVPKGLPEPHAKRTVEGDMGVRYNAASIVEAVGLERFAAGIDLPPERVRAWVDRVSRETETLAVTPEERRIDRELACQAARLSFLRHVGRTETHYTFMGVLYALYGKDLSAVKTVIGTGGPLVHSPDPGYILGAVRRNEAEPEYLCPEDPTFYIDEKYILYAGGLLGESRPELAVRLMKKYLKKVN